MPTIGNITACILDGGVHGTPLPEYDVNVTTGPDGVLCASCWVPSQAGKKFAIEWTDQGQAARETRGKVKIDGLRIGNSYIYGKYKSATRSSVSALGKMRRPLIFSVIETTDHDEMLTSPSLSRVGELGEISLEIIPCTVTGHQLARSSGKAFAIPTEKIPERSKKAGTHRVQLGEPEVPTYGVFEINARDRGAPIARFLFRYRPLAILQAQGTAPRQQGSIREDGDEEDDERAEMERLEARLDELKQKHLPRRTVKAEPITIDLTKPEVERQPDIIDLTSD